MSRSSLLIGVVIAVLAHVLLLWPGTAPRWQPLPTPASRPAPVAVRPPEPEPPAASPERRPAPESGAERSRLPVRVEEVATAQSPEPAEEGPGETSAEEADEDALPPVRIQWDGPEAMRRLAHDLHMRILGVDSSGKVLGEVSTTGPLEMLPFEGGLGSYSNRVRRIDDRGFFGSGILESAEASLAGFWVLVPAPLDRQISREVRSAIDRAGDDPGEVRFVRARFRRARGMPPEFAVQEIIRETR